MGYTHYWDGAHNSDSQWQSFCEDVRKILQTTNVPIVREYDRNDPPEISDNLVAFNGVNDDGHKTFYVERKGIGFAFCKTARKPYDKVVIACLIAGFENDIFSSVSSDGRGEEGFDQAGKELYELALQKSPNKWIDNWKVEE